MKHDLDDIVSSGDIARLLGVSPSAVANYKSRHADFPEPLPTASAGTPLYSRLAVVRWWMRRHPELAEAVLDSQGSGR